MGDRNTNGERGLVTLDDQEMRLRKDAITFVDKEFRVSETVNHLQSLMKNVTKDEINADTVNAACNCVQNLNLTIKTAIQAARFLRRES